MVSGRVAGWFFSAGKSCLEHVVRERLVKVLRKLIEFDFPLQFFDKLKINYKVIFDGCVLEMSVESEVNL